MTREWTLQPGTSRKGGITGGLTSLLLVAIGLFLLVGLIQSRFALGSSLPLMDIGGLAGFFQGNFGWIPSFYFSLLLLIWGGFSFVNGELSDPLKRILASACFLFFFSGLVACLGGKGGSMGGGASASMAALIGVVPSGLFFAVLSLLGLFLATDWFFYKGFKRFLLPIRVEIPEDLGLAAEEESLLVGQLEDESVSPPRAGARRDRRVAKLAASPPAEVSPVEVVPSEAAHDAANLDQILKKARMDLRGEQKEIFVFHEELEETRVEDRAKDRTKDGLEATIRKGQSSSPMDFNKSEYGFDVEEGWEGELGSSPVEDGLVPEEGLDDDLFATLENETLLEEAGKALDKILDEEGPRFHQESLEEMNEVVLDPLPRAEPKIEIYKAPPSGEEKKKPSPKQALLFSETPPKPELVHRAAQILLTSRRPLPSLLQRRLGIGLAEAREIFSHLKELGALGEPEGRGPWEPLMTLPEWEELMQQELGKSHRID